MSDQSLYSGHRQRIREKYVKGGADAMLEYEILELLLTYAIQRRNVKPIAKALLTKFKSLSGVVDASIDELSACAGLGTNSAILLKLVRDLSVQYLSQNIRKETFMGAPEAFFNYARMRLGAYESETMMVFYLNIKNYLIDAEVFEAGATDYVNVYPTTIAKKALIRNAKAIVLCHNHPSGVVSPSIDDTSVTRSVKKTLSSVGIALLDHIIVSKFAYYSYREADLEKPTSFRVLDPQPGE